MATIQYVLNAINNVSRVFNDIASDGAKLDGVLKGLSAQAEKTNAALGDLEGGAKLASAALDDVMEAASRAQAAMGQAADAATSLRDDLLGAGAAASRMTGDLKDLRTSTLAAAGAQGLLGTAALGAGALAAGSYGAWFGLWRVLMNIGKIPLFGGLASIGPLHLALDLLAEFVAVVLPATLAVAAFGVAAAESFHNVATQMSNMNTIAVATGRSIGPLNGAFAKLQNAVQPQVYQIFGDALTIINGKTSEFAKLATATGVVLDQLAARFTTAVTHGGGTFTAFMSKAVQDVAKLGDILANLGSALSQPLKFLPGYANILLNLIDAFSKFVAWVARAADPLFKFGLLLHGAFVYAGLAVTLILKLGSALVGLGLSFAKAIVGIYGYVVASAAAVGELVFLAGAMALLGAVDPLVWVGVGIAALAGLVLWLTHAKTAMQEYIAAQQKMVMNANVGNGLTALLTEQQNIAVKLAAANETLGHTQEYVNTVNTHTGAIMTATNPAYATALQNVNDLKGGYQNASDQANLYIYRLNALGKQFGGTAEASGLLTAAGVTQSQFLSKNKEDWYNVQTAVAGVAAGYKAMGQQGGALGNGLQVMDIQANDQYQAMQKLNTAWDTFIADATKAQTSFDTYWTGLGSIATAAKKTGASMDGLNTNSIALNGAFESQVTNVNALLDSFRQAGLSSATFTHGVKDVIAPMVQYAKGSQEATDQLVRESPRKPGTSASASLQSLTKWLGTTHDSTKALKDIVNQATTQESLLTSALNNQGNLIANKVVGDINEAILAYDGVYKAATAYGKAVAEDGAQSDAARAARQRLIQDLIASGKAAGDSKQQIAEMIAKVDKIPLKKALEIVMSGDGSFSIKGSAGLPAVHGIGAKIPGAAKGTYVASGQHGVDDQLIMAQRGELVVPSHMVKAGAVDHLRGKIPGFAAGGFVESGNKNVLTGQQAVIDYNNFQTTMATAMVDDMRSAIKSAAAALQGVGGSSGNVQSYARDVLLVLAQLHQPASALPIVLSQMTTESGGNPTIVNKTDSNWLAGTPSVGLMQVIGPTFDSYAGPYRSVGPYEYGVSVNPMANIYAGLNYAIHRYPGYWESVLGHGHGYANGGMINEPIIGIGRSGQMYGFGEAGPEMVVPWALNKLGPPGSTGIATGSPVFNSSPFIGAGGSGAGVLPGQLVRPSKKTVQPGGTKIPPPAGAGGSGSTSTGSSTGTSDADTAKALAAIEATLMQILAVLIAAPGQQGTAIARALNGTARRVGAQPGGPIRPY